MLNGVQRPAGIDYCMHARKLHIEIRFLRITTICKYLLCVPLFVCFSDICGQVTSGVYESKTLNINHSIQSHVASTIFALGPREKMVALGNEEHFTAKFYNTSGNSLGFFTHKTGPNKWLINNQEEALGNVLFHGASSVWIPYDLSQPETPTLKTRCMDGYGQHEGHLYQVDSESFHLTGAIKVGNLPFHLAIVPDSDLILCANYCSKDISIVNTVTRQEVTRILLGEHPRSIQSFRPHNKAYITMDDASRIGIIDFGTLELSGFLDVGTRLWQLQLGNSSGALYACTRPHGSIRKFDPVTGKSIASNNAIDGITRITLSKDERFLYAINPKIAKLWKFSASDLQLMEIKNLPSKPQNILMGFYGIALWVKTENGNLLKIIDTETLNMRGGFPLGPQPPTWQESQQKAEDLWLFMNYISPSEINYSLTSSQQATPSANGQISQYNKQNGISSVAQQTSETGLSQANEIPQSSLTRNKNLLASKMGLGNNQIKVDYAQQKFFLVVGTYNRRALAKINKEKWESEGFQPIILSDKARRKYRICALGFNDYNKAKSSVNALKRRKIQAWILTRPD